MKKLAKIALVVMCAIALVVCSILGTLAYLQSQSGVAKNTFTAGNVAITLDETDVDLYGVKDGDTRVLANQYKLISGHTYTKDPQVTVLANSEACYVMMKVTITDIADVKAVLGADFLPENFTNGTWDSEDWKSVDVVDNSDNSITYVFHYNGRVAASTTDTKLDPLFTEFKLPGTVNNAGIEQIKDMEINVQAFAIQADGFADAATAFAQFDFNQN